MRKLSYWASLITCTAALVVALPLLAKSQTRDKFVISAKAGGINAVTGRAIVHGRGTTEWEQLTIKADLVSGDVVKTGFDGRVEMLLNPGSYLRVGENSEFELINGTLENLEVRLLRGTAIVEAAGADDTELMINISTPDTRMAIVRRGLYRVNVVPGDGTELIVRKGRVMLDSHTKIKAGNKVTFSSSGLSIAKLQGSEKKAVDAIDNWSKERAEVVAKANRRIRSRDLGMLMAGWNDGWLNGYVSRSGLWFYNSVYNCYTFLPSFYGRWTSPYGYGYAYGLAPYGNYYWSGGHLFGVSNGAASNVPGNLGNTSTLGNVGNRGIGSGGNGASSPAPVMSAPRETPSGVPMKVERLNDRMPQP
jgi:hypothetical protein